MNVIKKDAAISNTGAADDFPGTFQVILSAPTKDRDGDTLLPEDWKQPLPEKITFDQDHGMNVASTVGSGKPEIDPATGNLIVTGTYSSLPRAQEVRTLVNEGHIDRTSVAFMNEKQPQKDGTSKTVRELLNGAFVAIPSNREAAVLSSKGLKSGARNSAADKASIQGIHDAAAELGAECANGKALHLPASQKDADTDADDDPGTLAQAVDAAIDEATDLLAAVDVASLPAEVQQAIALIQAADTAVDQLLAALGVEDPDEDAQPAAGTEKDPATGAATAPAAGTRSAPATPDQAAAIQIRAARIRANLNLNA